MPVGLPHLLPIHTISTNEGEPTVHCVMSLAAKNLACYKKLVLRLASGVRATAVDCPGKLFLKGFFTPTPQNRQQHQGQDHDGREQETDADRACNEDHRITIGNLQRAFEVLFDNWL